MSTAGGENRRVEYAQHDSLNVQSEMFEVPDEIRESVMLESDLENNECYQIETEGSVEDTDEEAEVETVEGSGNETNEDEEVDDIGRDWTLGDVVNESVGIGSQHEQRTTETEILIRKAEVIPIQSNSGVKEAAGTQYEVGETKKKCDKVRTDSRGVEKETNTADTLQKVEENEECEYTKYDEGWVQIEKKFGNNKDGEQAIFSEEGGMPHMIEFRDDYSDMTLSDREVDDSEIFGKVEGTQLYDKYNNNIENEQTRHESDFPCNKNNFDNEGHSTMIRNAADLEKQNSIDVESIEVPPQAIPDMESDVYIIKLPSNISFIPSPLDINDKCAVPVGATDVIRWQFKKDSDGKLIRDNNGNIMRESNTKLVEWDDGTFSLFIGSHIYECQVQNDETYVFENSQEEIKILHSIASKRFKIRSTDYLYNKDIIGVKSNLFRGTNRKTKLTSTSEAIASGQIVNQALNQQKEVERLRRKQRSMIKNTGLTRNFLEESDNERDDEIYTTLATM